MATGSLKKSYDYTKLLTVARVNNSYFDSTEIARLRAKDCGTLYTLSIQMKNTGAFSGLSDFVSIATISGWTDAAVEGTIATFTNADDNYKLFFKVSQNGTISVYTPQTVSTGKWWRGFIVVPKTDR